MSSALVPKLQLPPWFPSSSLVTSEKDVWFAERTTTIIPRTMLTQNAGSGRTPSLAVLSLGLRVAAWVMGGQWWLESSEPVFLRTGGLTIIGRPAAVGLCAERIALGICLMYKTLRISLPLVLLAGVVGCQGMSGPFSTGPGTVAVQQERAERFDPYPENEIGPPIEGARPREYQTPPAEVQRSRWSGADWGF